MIGYQFFQEKDFFWRRHHGALLPLAMPHIEPEYSTSKLRQLLVSRRAVFVRWDENFDNFRESEWWHVIKDTPEELSELRKKTRWQVRRGGRRFDAAPVSREIILSEGYPVYRAAFTRYETFEEILSEDAFQKAVSGLPNETEFWVLSDREGDSIVAFSENLVCNDACFYNTMWFDPEALKAYAGYVLIHEMNKHYLNERGLRYVSDGARNISHKTGIHEFLEQKFGFRRAYSRLHVVYAPGIGLAVKLMYLFRRFFSGRSSGMLQKLAILLDQERIRRACLADGQAR